MRTKLTAMTRIEPSWQIFVCNIELFIPRQNNQFVPTYYQGIITELFRMINMQIEGYIKCYIPFIDFNFDL